MMIPKCDKNVALEILTQGECIIVTKSNISISEKECEIC